MSGCRPGDCDPETCIGRQGVFDDRRGRDLRNLGLIAANLGTRPGPRSIGLVEHHAFNRALRESSQEKIEISDQRAEQYGDSWDLDQMRGGLLASTLALPQPPHLRKEFIRLARCAVMVDVKDSRLDGPYRADSLLDKTNYEDVYRQWRASYELALDQL